VNRRVVRILGSAVLALTTMVPLTTAAAALTSVVEPTTAWHRYHQDDFTVPAGEGCSFKVTGTVLYDREYFRNLSRYRNGNVRVQLFRGPLIIQYKNMSNGTKVIRDQSGVAKERFNRDGSFASIKVISGYFGATLSPGSNLETGVYYLGGQGTALFENADGTETVKLGPDGTAQNLCPILAG